MARNIKSRLALRCWYQRSSIGVSFIATVAALCFLAVSPAYGQMGNVYNYADASYDEYQGVVIGYGSVIDDYNSFGHDYSVYVIVQSPSGRMASFDSGFSSGGQGWVYLDTFGEEGQFLATSTSTIFCPIAYTYYPGGSASGSVTVMAPITTITSVSFSKTATYPGDSDSAKLTVTLRQTGAVGSGQVDVSITGGGELSLDGSGVATQPFNLNPGEAKGFDFIISIPTTQPNTVQYPVTLSGKGHVSVVMPAVVENNDMMSSNSLTVNLRGQ